MTEKRKVTLTYFKPSGKYYSTGEYETEKADFEIPREVVEMIKSGKNPGLLDGSVLLSEFSVLIVGGQHEVPHLLTFNAIKDRIAFGWPEYVPMHRR